MNTFVDEYRAGRADAGTIHDWIDHWHDADATDEALPYALNEYLGLTWREYSK